MKLTDEIKEKLKNAKTEEERKAILEEMKDKTEEAGVLLSEEDLEKVAGGWWFY